MKTSKRILSIILSVIMILSLIPLTASAVEYSGTCGENLTWHLDDATGVFTISGTGDMVKYNGLTKMPEWKNKKLYIEYVYIEEGVTSISGYAFSNCINLKHVEIPDSVTEIGAKAFYSCTDLKYVEIPDSVTKIGSEAFSGGEALEKITLGTGLVEISKSAIPKTVSIFYKGTLEEWCKLEKNNQYSFSEAGYAIHCTDADIYPKGVHSDNITWEFNDITGTLSFFGTGDMIGYEDASDALDASYRTYKSQIKKIVLSEGVTSIGDYNFYSFSGFKDFVIPSSVTSISSTAFLLNEKETFPAVIYYGGTLAQWKEIESTFDYRYENNFAVCCIDGNIPLEGTCGENLVWQLDGVTGVLTISGSGAMDDYSEYSTYDDNMAPWSAFARGIKSVIIKEGVESVGEYAFYWCEPKDVFISEGVTTIGECALLGAENITLPESITRIGMYNFLTSTTIHYAGTKKQWHVLEKEYEYLFTSYHRVYCSDGELLPSGVCGKNATWVFDNDTGTLTISGTGAIDDCVYLKNGFIYFHQPWMHYQYDIKVVNVEEGITLIGRSAFESLHNLQSVTLPSTLKTIGASAFWGCLSLERIVIPYGVTGIGETAFGACMSLKNVIIPDSVTKIGSGALKDCQILKSITIPVSVTSVEKYAFGGDDEGANSTIEDIYYMGSVAQWQSIKNIAYGLDNTTVHYNSKKTEYAATCTNPGYIEYTCDSCGVCRTEALEEATGHKYVASSIEATCTQHGYTIYTCEDCGHSYKDYTSNPTGHTFNDEGVCEGCGVKETVKTPVSTNPAYNASNIFEIIINMILSLFTSLFAN